MKLKGLVKKLFGVSPISLVEESPGKSRMDPRPIKEVMNGMRGRYQEMVKPHIDSGNYYVASMELRDIYSYWQTRAEELFIDIHSGLGYFAAMQVLINQLETATERPDIAIQAFEAYQAQTKLPSEKDLAEI